MRYSDEEGGFKNDFQISNLQIGEKLEILSKYGVQRRKTLGRRAMSSLWAQWFECALEYSALGCLIFRDKVYFANACLAIISTVGE